MATKLVIDFKNSEGGTSRASYNFTDPDVTTQNVKNLINTIITNGSIFEKVPTEAQSAKLVTTTETELDLS